MGAEKDTLMPGDNESTASTRRTNNRLTEWQKVHLLIGADRWSRVETWLRHLLRTEITCHGYAVSVMALNATDYGNNNCIAVPWSNIRLCRSAELVCLSI